MIIQWLKEATLGFLDFVYPIGCRGCGVFGDGYICKDCLSSLLFVTDPKCRHCSLPLENEKHSYCKRCALHFGYHDGGVSIALYFDPLGKLIRELKYDRQIGIAEFFADLVISRLGSDQAIDNLKCDYIHPIPLSSRRMKLRGFNQSAIIAKHLAMRMSIEYRDDLILRTKDTATQIGMGIDARMANVKGAFHVPDMLEIENISILLIDDVLTTGATIEECARILKLAGSGRIKFITIARHILDESNENQ